MKRFIQILIQGILIVICTSGYAQVFAPDFTMTDTDGDTYNLYDECDQGKIIVLDFFYKSCPSCQVNTSKLDSIWQRYGANGDSVWVWGIEGVLNGPPSATNTEIDAFKNTYGATFPCFSTSYNSDTVLSLYGIYANPRYFVVCSDRKVKPCIINDISTYIDICLIVLNSEEDLKQRYGIKSVFQNSGGLIIGFELKNSEGAYFDLHDIHGQLIKRGNIESNSGIFKITRLSSEKGMYFIRIYSQGDIIDQKKIMIL